MVDYREILRLDSLGAGVGRRKGAAGWETLAKTDENGEYWIRLLPGSHNIVMNTGAQIYYNYQRIWPFLEIFVDVKRRWDYRGSAPKVDQH